MHFLNAANLKFLFIKETKNSTEISLKYPRIPSLIEIGDTKKTDIISKLTLFGLNDLQS